MKDKYFILARENMDFNDEYWTENYISILKDDYEEFYPFFRIWLTIQLILKWFCLNVILNLICQFHIQKASS